MPPLMRIYQNPIVLLALQTLLAVLISACSAETAPEPEIQGMMNSAIPSIVLETDPEIQIINFSSHPTEEFVRWANSASEQMESRESSILVFVYDVGEPKRPETRIPDTPFHEHEVLMSLDEQELLLSGIKHWLQQDPCMGNNRGRVTEEMARYKLWLQRGADSSTQQALCPKTRVVAIALTDSLRNQEPPEETQMFFIHEMYHAFQHDLEDEGLCRSRMEQPESNTGWMVEGGAHYFSTMLVAGAQDSKDGVSQILHDALRISEDEGTNIDEVSNDRSGAAALRLMIERGMVTEEAIMGGRFFHACARELEFDSNSPGIQFIRHNWYKIQRGNGGYYFDDTALSASPGNS
jgi:hypothetical protein